MKTLRLFLIAIAAWLVTVVGGMGQSSAATGDRPTNVAAVRGGSTLLLQPDGTITGDVRVRCDPGWVSGEISATLVQGQSSADAFTVTSVPCDGHWYSVSLTFVPGTGTFQPGKVTFSFLQFLVTNAVTGDSAGAHDNGATARLKAAG